MSSEDRRVLLRQVREQSDGCDVTIKLDQWERKFHWRVLEKSPFFESLYRNGWKEAQTGEVQLYLGKPWAVGAAIMFLYGSRPNITEDSVLEWQDLLEISDFLFLQTLKDICLDVIKTMKITPINCMALLDLSQKYNVDIDGLHDFVMGHLPEALTQEPATRLTTESVLDILTDPRLACLSVQNKFSFITKWADAFQENGREFPTVFNAIDMDDADLEFLENVVLRHPRVAQLNWQIPPIKVTPDEHRVLIFPESSKNDRLLCFDLDGWKWRGIDTKLPANVFKCCPNSAQMCILTSVSIEGILNETLSDVYTIYRCDSCINIFKQNLRDRRFRDVGTIDLNDRGYQRNVYKACANGNIIAAVANVTHYIHIEEVEEWTWFENCLPIQIKSTVLLHGKLDKSLFHMRPIFTLTGTRIDSLCFSSENVVSLLSVKQRRVYIYDISHCRLDVIQLDDYFGKSGIDVAACDGGFVIYDNRNFMTVRCHPEGSKANGCVVNKYADFPYDSDWCHVTYRFCANMWLRFVQRDGTFECALKHHTELTERQGPELPWTPIPIQEEEFTRATLRSRQVFMIQLPKTALNCHFRCPHRIVQCSSQESWKQEFNWQMFSPLFK